MVFLFFLIFCWKYNSTTGSEVRWPRLLPSRLRLTASHRIDVDRRITSVMVGTTVKKQNKRRTKRERETSDDQVRPEGGVKDQCVVPLHFCVTSQSDDVVDIRRGRRRGRRRTRQRCEKWTATSADAFYSTTDGINDGRRFSAALELRRIGARLGPNTKK